MIIDGTSLRQSLLPRTSGNLPRQGIFSVMESDICNGYFTVQVSRALAMHTGHDKHGHLVLPDAAQRICAFMYASF